MTGISILAIYCDGSRANSAARIQEVARSVANELVSLIPRTANVISFDGFDAVGKSTLAKSLREVLDFQLIALDDFLEEDPDGFLSSLKLGELTDVFDNRIRSGGGLIIEGCLVDSVLKEIGRFADFRVYVMEISRPIPSDDVESVKEFDVLYGERSVDELITRIEERYEGAAKVSAELCGSQNNEDSGASSLKRELIHYHRNFRPHDRASLIIKVIV